MEMAQNQDHASNADVPYLTGQDVAQLGNLGKLVQLGELGELGGAGQLGNKTHKPAMMMGHGHAAHAQGQLGHARSMQHEPSSPPRPLACGFH